MRRAEHRSEGWQPHRSFAEGERRNLGRVLAKGPWAGRLRTFVWLALLPTLGVAGVSQELTNDWRGPGDLHSDSSPAVGAGGTIYFGTWEGNLWALNTDGTREWVFNAESEI